MKLDAIFGLCYVRDRLLALLVFSNNIDNWNEKKRDVLTSHSHSMLQQFYCLDWQL